MAKIAVTPTIVLAEFLLFRKTVSYQKVTTRHVKIHGFMNEINVYCFGW